MFLLSQVLTIRLNQVLTCHTKFSRLLDSGNLKMILKAVIFSIFLQLVSCTYQPGDSGAPWSEEEIDIVRDKVGKYTYLLHG